MGAKKKPQETLSLADLGVDADARRRGRLADRGARARRPAAARRLAQDRGRRLRRRDRSSSSSRRSGSLMSTLVFLEHHDGELQKGSLGVLVEGRAARRRRRRRWSSARASTDWPPRPASTARRRSTSPTTPRSRRRCRSRASTRSRSSSRDTGFDNVLFAAVGARRRRRRRPGGAARRRAQLGPRRPRAPQDGALVGKRPALGDSVLVDVGWTSTPRLALVRSGSVRPGRSRRRRGGGRARSTAELEDFSLAAEMVEQAHEESSGPSIEDADVIVAGGRGLGEPGEASRSSRSSRRRSAARSRATRAVVDAGWYPYATQVGQTGKTRLAEALHRLRDLRRDPAQGRHAGLGHDRRDQQGPERADLRVRRPRRRRRPAPDRPEAGRARPARGRA